MSIFPGPVPGGGTRRGPASGRPPISPVPATGPVAPRPTTAPTGGMSFGARVPYGADGNNTGGLPIGNNGRPTTPATPPRSGGVGGGGGARSGGGGVRSSGAGGVPAAAATPGTTNTSSGSPDLNNFNNQMGNRISQYEGQGGDPNLAWGLQQLKDRMGPGATQRAIDIASQNIDANAAGQRQMLSENLARRGMGGAGVEAEGLQKITEDAQRQRAGVAANVSLGRERDIDQLLLGGQNMIGAQGQYGLQRQGMLNNMYGLQLQGAGAAANYGLGQQRLGLDQLNSDRQYDLGRANLAQQANQNQMAQWMSLMGMLGNTSYY